ncbi:RNA polymerase factor sigma-54 [Loigolactobacillus backii]|uniref:RNA polymerase factor sigma-54 n=1 Tax=Loigolactobacillus backii TaxID=375175 RepID=UPI000C1CC180|nr:RNA polymerase factor sigma-54 [Loigolactobacillus backii]PIO83872.1 RNA polymerase factor sigma-54 [Loigolactobacillus backii]
MPLKQAMSQQQKQVQKLVMTQQLQQSIQMLQFSVDGLQKFLEQKSLENPLIELKADYSGGTTASSLTGNRTDNYMNAIPDTPSSLFDYLLQQVRLTLRDTPLRDLVLFLLEYVDSNGYLKISLADATEKTGADQLQLLDAITLLQQLDPPGVGARDLQECLLLQIQEDNTAPNLAYIVLEESFNDFVDRNWDKIAKRYQTTLAEVQHILDYIQTLSPNPGAIFTQNQNNYIIPDLLVQKEANNQLSVRPTRSGRPRLMFQQHYFNQMVRTKDQEVTDYMKEKKQEFDWLKRSLVQRGDTILRVGQVIVQRQIDFFLRPDHPLQPLMLRDVAQTLDLHESTISRSVNGKYLQADFGVFELRHFFSNAVGGSVGDQFSADNVQQRLKQLINAEDKKKPLSDQKLVKLLEEKNISISRRTVAKYRESLGILSSSKRKRF